MIGLLDYDWCSSKSTTSLIPNLEIMKLATYYKIEENKYCRLLDLNEESLDSYNKIYFFSESDQPITIPENYLRAANVIYGGAALTNGKYIPFENSIIDYTIARPAIYKDFLKQKYQDGVKTKIISHVLDDSYYRMKSGDNVLPIPPIMPNKRVIIYDTEFFIPEWKNIIEKIIARKPSSIVLIHPVKCKKISDYFYLRNEKHFARTNSIILDLDIPLDEVPYMMKKYKAQFLADIVESSEVYLPIGETFKSSNQYYKDFIYKINMLYTFWSVGIPIKIKFFAPSIGIVNPLQNIEQLLEAWTCGETKKTKTLNDRIHKGISKEKKKSVIEEKEKFLTAFPKTKELFFQTYISLKQGGWRI